MKLLRTFPLHPLLLAAYPVVYLLAANISQISPAAAFRPLLVSLAMAAVLLGLLWLLLRDVRRAALLVSLGLALFFTYGHALTFLKVHPLGGVVIGRHRYLIWLYLALLAWGVWRVLRVRSRRQLGRLTGALNVAAMALVAFSLVQIGAHAVRTARAAASLERAAATDTTPAASLPDVYILVLDSYARADVLQSFFGYDNRPFLDELKQMGFTIAECSAANYQTTEYSLASMLNFEYMQTFADYFGGIDGKNGDMLPPLIKDSQVRQRLEALGYSVTAFESGYAFTDWWGSDTFYAPGENDKLITTGLHPFEALLLKTTAASLLLDSQIPLFGDRIKKSANFPYTAHINNVELALSKLPTLPLQPSPKLVFAHLIVPHKPMVFKADGSIQTDENYYANEGDPVNLEYFQRGYVNQVAFINARLLPILRWIIQDSQTPPVIVLIGDHGYAWGDSTFANLAAFYLPGGGGADIYPTISNVNFFRVIFDRYFGTKFGLLPDDSYFTDTSTASGFRLAAECVSGCPLCKFEDNK